LKIKFGGKAFPDYIGAHPHKDNRMSEGVESLYRPYIVLGDRNQMIMATRQNFSISTKNSLLDLLIKASNTLFFV